METTLLIAAAVFLALVSYLALVRPMSIVRAMHAMLAGWIRLFGSNVMTHEQSAQIEMARRDPRAYEQANYAQITIVRLLGLAAILVAAGLTCLAFT
jgi:hypothetical protein